MAWRETRAAWRHVLYFFICIALGIGAVVGIDLFATHVEQTVTREARGLMGGDVEVRTSKPLSKESASILRNLADYGIAMMHVSELVAMASRVGGVKSGSAEASKLPTQIVELKAVEPNYPFYGMLKTSPGRPLVSLLAPTQGPCPSAQASFSFPEEKEGGDGGEKLCFGAVVHESLLIKMGLTVGEQIKIGQASFTITGLLRQEPDRVASILSLGPRVIISQDGLTAAELVKPGSRVRERYLLRLPPTVAPEPLVYQLREQLAADSARVSTYRDAQPQLRRPMEQLARYLGLIALTALLIGGIGVASTMHAFLKEKLRTIAILKTLGADSSTIVRTYLTQALLLGFVGSLGGIILGASLQGVMPRLLAGVVPPDLLQLVIVRQSFSILPLLKGLALGISATLLFTLWPLLAIRQVRPASIFRSEVTPLTEPTEASGLRLVWLRICTDPVRWLAALVVTTGLAGLAVWQAGSLSVGLLFIGALAVAGVTLRTAAWLLMRVLAWAPSPRSLAMRHALGNLHRPGSQAMSVTVSVGIGVMVIVAVSLLEHSLIQEVGENRPVDAPTFFFIDIQPDQKERFQRAVAEQLGGLQPEMTPLVRSRLHRVNGRVIDLNEDGEQDRGQERRRGEKGKSWYFTREYVLTFLDRLPKDNILTKGEWWKPDERSNLPLLSVEEDAARNLGLTLGSVVEFDIQGTIVRAEVRSIRKVEWNNFSTNFYMILSPGSLEGAPFTYVATVRVKPDQELPLQEAVVAEFPNVTAINLGEVVETFIRVLEHLSFAIRVVALFCVLAGAVVMAAALATSRYRRLYESAVLKALGATRGVIARSFASEYALLGAVAGLIGIVLASALSWTILHFVLDLPWTLQAQTLAAGFGGTVLLTLLVGFLSTFRILGQRPWAILRHE